MDKKTMIVGIDPDTVKSGVAVYDKETKKLELSCLSFFELQDYLSNAKKCIKVVKIEAGYLNKKNNWHISKNIRTASRVGANVGANHEVGKKIVEMCKYLEIDYIECKPLKKTNGNKVSGVELKRRLIQLGINPIIGRTNQEMRDAALIAIY